MIEFNVRSFYDAPVIQKWGKFNVRSFYDGIFDLYLMRKVSGNTYLMP